MRFWAFILVGAISVFAAAAATAADTLTLPNCLLLLDAEALVPAQEAGLLVSIPVHDGQQVSKGELLAQIDDALPRAQRDVATFKLKAAEREAADDISIRYASAAAAVAEAEWLQSTDANKRVSGTVPQAEVRRLLLKHREMVLSIEKAQKDRAIAEFQARVNQAELAAANVNIERRRVVSPLDAVVVELSRHEGEWVQAGETIMRLVRIDLLRVEGLFNTNEYRPSELQNRPVQVAVTLARGQKAVFDGRVVFVKPMVQAGGEMLVRAEVRNRRENGVWVLNPGMSAEMTIQLK